MRSDANSGWNEVVFDFANPVIRWVDSTNGEVATPISADATYDKLNLFIDWNNGKDFAGNQVGEAITQDVTYYVDNVVMGFGQPVYYQGGSNQTEQESSDPADWTLTELTLTFDASDDSGYVLTDFGGNASSVVTGTDAPANSDGSVVKVLKTAGAQTWAGTTFLDVSGDGELISDGNTVVTADVFSAKDDATVLLKLEDGSNSSNFIELGGFDGKQWLGSMGESFLGSINSFRIRPQQ